MRRAIERVLLAQFATAADVVANSYAESERRRTGSIKVKGCGWSIPLPGMELQATGRMDRERFRFEGRRLCAEAIAVLEAAGFGKWRDR